MQIEIACVHVGHFGVYGAPKIWAQLNRGGIRVACCTVERMMRDPSLQGTVRGKVKRTTGAGNTADRPRDLVDRQLCAEAPNHSWVADLSHIRTWSGFVYVASITEVFSRRVVGWQPSRSLKTIVLRSFERPNRTARDAGAAKKRFSARYTRYQGRSTSRLAITCDRISGARRLR